MKIYASTVEGLLLNNPAAILHMGQTLRVETDTVDVLTAVTKGELVLKTVVTPEPVISSDEPKPPAGDDAGANTEEDTEKQQKDAKNRRPRGK